MNFKNIKNEQTNSTILSLEQLSKQYSNAIIKYNQAQLDYAYYLNKVTGNNLIHIKGSSFWGSTGLKQGNANNINECKAMCLSNKKCTGATYNQDKKYCWTRTGNSAIIPSSSNEYAIIPEKINLLNNIKFYNQQLLNINKKINNIINNNIPLYKDQSKDRSANYPILNNNYRNLMLQREKIETEIKKFESLDRIQNENILKINYYSYIYFILIIFCFIFIFILLRLTYYGKVFIETTNDVIDTTKNVIVDAGNQVVNAGKVVADSGKQLALNAGDAVVNAGKELKDAAVNVGDVVVNAGKDVIDAGNNIITKTKEVINGTNQTNNYPNNNQQT